MQIEKPSRFPQIVPLGIDCLLVRFGDRLSDRANRAALAFRSVVQAADIPGILETANSLTAVNVRFDPTALRHDNTLQKELELLLHGQDWFSADLPERRRLWHVPAVYGGEHGPHLAQAASKVGITEAQAVAELSAVRLRIMTIGFAPGLPYLGQLPEIWDLPRQTHLDTLAPAGALCLAVRQLVLFPAPSRTGWLRIAQTGFRGFRPEYADPFPLAAGDEMVFPPASAEELDRQGTPDGGAWCEALP